MTDFKINISRCIITYVCMYVCMIMYSRCIINISTFLYNPYSQNFNGIKYLLINKRPQLTIKILRLITPAIINFHSIKFPFRNDKITHLHPLLLKLPYKKVSFLSTTATRALAKTYRAPHNRARSNAIQAS